MFGELDADITAGVNHAFCRRYEVVEWASPTKTRSRLFPELMARCEMRVGEVLKLKLKDIEERKLILRQPKSGKAHEIVFIPQQVIDIPSFITANYCRPAVINRNNQSVDTSNCVKFYQTNM